jgi:hypothetical protein
MRMASRKFKSRMRRLKITGYAMTLEAHANGGCHARMIAIFGVVIHKCPVKKRKKSTGMG